MSTRPVSRAQAERFRRLAWPLMPVVLRTAQCLTRRDDQAEDLAQEAMVKAMRSIDSFQEGTDIKAWLLTILRRTYIDRLRAERNRPLRLSLDADQIGQTSDESAPGRFDGEWDEPEQLMARFEDEAVIGALRELPDDVRWTVLLVDVEQMEQADAAAVLGVAVGTIKSRTHRGRAMLRDRLHELAVQRGWAGVREQSS